MRMMARIIFFLAFLVGALGYAGTAPAQPQRFATLEGTLIREYGPQLSDPSTWLGKKAHQERYVLQDNKGQVIAYLEFSEWISNYSLADFIGKPVSVYGPLDPSAPKDTLYLHVQHMQLHFNATQSSSRS